MTAKAVIQTTSNAKRRLAMMGYKVALEQQQQIDYLKQQNADLLAAITAKKS